LRKLFKLDNRLKAISEMICGGVIADIGSDHAYLPIWLYLNKKIEKAYAADISENCVKRISANIKKYDISPEIIIPVLSNGLNNLNDFEITDVIIAGMGGINIAEILAGAACLRGVNLILQPNRKVEYLRDFLRENNFEIIKEITAESKKRFYNIINARLNT